LRSFDLGNLRKSWGNIFNDYIFEISGFRYLFDFDLKIRSGQV
jgi:hypothetical protein